MKIFVKVWLGIGLLAIGFGIAILIVAAASGVSWRDVPTYSMDESFEGIESIDIQIGAGEVIIVEGDDFHVKADNIPKDSFQSHVTSDGTWVIKQDRDYIVDLFGVHFSIGQIAWWKDEFRPEVTITIPKDFTASEFSFEIGAGRADVETILAQKGRFTVGAGKIVIDQLNISEASDYEVGAGEMIINQMMVNNITVECGFGDVNMNGTVTGESSVECGVGSINLDLSGDLEDYSFRVENGIGSIRINNESYRNLQERNLLSGEARNSLDLECGVGSISIDIDNN
ncbi:MAG: hypothetical protein K0S76_2216 [Herbinix sp.]|jgi:hypothetical protein|nr:hypothetical protein [Herbinix sp.]